MFGGTLGVDHQAISYSWDLYTNNCGNYINIMEKSCILISLFNYSYDIINHYYFMEYVTHALYLLRKIKYQMKLLTIISFR